MRREASVCLRLCVLFVRIRFIGQFLNMAKKGLTNLFFSRYFKQFFFIQTLILVYTLWIKAIESDESKRC